MNLTQRTDDLLDDSLAALRAAAGDAERTRAVRALFEGLRSLRGAGCADSWRAVTSRVMAHPVRALIHEDPMTRRSFEKPRGYAGDAVLLDYIYRHTVLEDVTSTGRVVNDYAVGRPAACAVRHRRDYLAHRIDRVADRVEGARVLSVACGHLREGELSTAVRTGALGELVALDADEDSLAVVARAAYPRVRPVTLSIARLLAAGTRLGHFDLIYSAGLYDYLAQDLAAQLTERLFESLLPGGELLVSNFLPGVTDAGFMESFLGWELLLRDLPAIEAFGACVDPAQVADARVYEDPFGAIGYCELSRR